MASDSSSSVAFITGAANGIGRAVSKTIIDMGWNAVLMDMDESITHLANTLRTPHSGTGQSIVGIRGDVRQEGDVASAVAEAGRMGVLALAFANAGVGAQPMELPDLPLEEFERVAGVNLTGTFLTCKHAGRAMRDARQGSIVVTSSVMWQSPVAGEAAYNATKAAVVGLTQALALDLAPYGVRANVVAPGAVMTNMHSGDMKRRAEARGVPIDTIEREDCEAIPLGRIADPQEVADVVAFLASHGSRYITGQVIGVNGGLALHF